MYPRLFSFATLALTLFVLQTNANNNNNNHHQAPFAIDPVLVSNDVVHVVDTPLPPTRPGGGWSWVDCNSGSEIIKVTNISVSPDPIKPGQKLTVHAKGILSQPLEQGSIANVVVKLGLIRLINKQFDICQEAKNANAQLQCPLAPGEYEFTHTVDLPKEIPPAKFSVQVTGSNQDDLDLICLKLGVNFMLKL